MRSQQCFFDRERQCHVCFEEKYNFEDKERVLGEQKEIYFAPLEGITGYIFRNLYEKRYGHGAIAKYFMPFITPNHTKGLKTREKQDVAPENNSTLHAVPQILTNRADDFLRMEKYLMEKGYQEINLNLGCPSGTVVSKRKGAGALENLIDLDRLLHGIFTGKEPETQISIKTRLGMYEPEEFDGILRIYEQYPISELIIHARVREEYYKGKPHRDVFQRACQVSSHSLCYNGDLFSLTDFQKACEEMPTVHKFMIGRGFLKMPDLIHAIAMDPIFVDTKFESRQWQQGGRNEDREYTASSTCQKNRENILRMENLVNQQKEQQTVASDADRLCQLHAFIQELQEAYQNAYQGNGEQATLFKMKELWSYLGQTLEGVDKPLKMIRKTRKLSEYESAVAEIFTCATIKPL
jgi:tRNA-dihydrouridine synthase